MEGTIFVVDDEPVMRSALRRLFESVGFGVATYASAEEFLVAYQADRVGCLVLDVCMPGMSGLGLQQELAARRIRIPIVFLTGSVDIPVAVEAMKAGATDFLEKPFGKQDLLQRVRGALELAPRMRVIESKRAETEKKHVRLTPRERQVMDLMVLGKLSKTIAYELGTSTRTVEVHRARVMEKMQADSLADLVRMMLAYDVAKATGDAQRQQ